MASERPEKLRPRRIEPEYFRTAYPKAPGRTLAIFLGVSAAILWLAFYRFADQPSVFSPGRVTSAHAMWNANCTACHQANPKGGFFLTVSDQACLRCHSANIHSPQQVEFISSDKTSSANCTHCHVEHQGHERLIDRTEQSCISCHGDLSHHSRLGTSNIQQSIVEFSLASHPRFGSTLPTRNGGPFDMTQLTFSHKIHLGKGLTCISCHHLDPDSSMAAGSLPTPLSEGNAAQRAYMRPVQFDRDCLNCHAMTFGEEKIPHADMAVVRESITRLSQAKTSPFALASQAEQDEGQDSQDSDSTAPRLTKNDSALGVIEPRVKQIASSSLSAAFARLKTAVRSKPIGLPGTIDPRLIQFYVFYVNSNSCVLCHTANTGDPTAWPQLDASSSLLATGDTGIGPAPRQWYVHSTFDHTAHRFMFQNEGTAGCVVCHAAAQDSESMGKILIPNIESCVACHHSPDNTGVGSGASCLECHVYHDHGTSAVANLATANPKNN